MGHVEIISSKQNDFFKKIKSYRLAKYRKQDNIVLVEGQKVYDEALSRLKPIFTVISESYLDKHEDMHTIVPSNLPFEKGQNLEGQQGREQEHRYLAMSDSLFATLSELKTDQGILGVFEIPKFQVDLMSLSRVVILEGVQDPTNVGAIIRNAHGLGYGAVFLGEECAHPFSPKAIRASMGSVFHIPVVSCTLFEQIQRLKDEDFVIVATDLAGDSKAAPFKKCALLIGSEGKGLSVEALSMSDEIFTIEMRNNAESLNAAVASGIAMYLFKE